jgi:hypothetical protein
MESVVAVYSMLRTTRNMCKNSEPLFNVNVSGTI